MNELSGLKQKLGFFFSLANLIAIFPRKMYDVTISKLNVMIYTHTHFSPHFKKFIASRIL